MKTLNLARPQQSDIKYLISKFPDGQQDITILELNTNSQFSYWAVPGDRDAFRSDVRKLFTINQSVAVQIKSQFRSFKDLELIICATKALRRLGVKEIHLYIP